MKIAVMGAGAVGCFFGGMLSRAGQEVWLVARGAHLKAMQEQGLAIESDAGSFQIPVKVAADPAAVGPADLILFCVKSYDTSQAARQMLPMIGPHTTVLSLQNGITNGEVLASIVGIEKVMVGTIYVQAHIAAPGLVRQEGKKRDIIFGELDGKITERASQILSAFKAAGIPVDLTGRIRELLWDKFIFITAFSGITALARTALGPVRETPEAWAVYREMLEEGCSVARINRIEMPADEVDRIIASTLNMKSTAKSSLLRDLEQGKRIEIEALTGTLVRLGAEAGVDTPLHRFTYALLKAAAGERESEQ